MLMRAIRRPEVRDRMSDVKGRRSDVGARGVRVGVLRPDGSAFSGFSISDCDVFQGDDCHYIMTWNGSSDLSALKGKEVKLRFEITGPVKLYAFQVLNVGGR